LNAVGVRIGFSICARLGFARAPEVHNFHHSFDVSRCRLTASATASELSLFLCLCETIHSVFASPVSSAGRYNHNREVLGKQLT
jgi:hypothetical protein